jgi:hypothetical protein
MATMSWRRSGNVLVIVHGDRPPQAEEWKAFLTDISAFEDIAACPALVYSAGGGPNALQRAALSEVLAGRPALTAIVTPSLTMRGIATALSWFNRRLKVFAPDRLPDAFAHLELDEPHRAIALELLRDRAAALGLTIPFAA